MHLPHVLINDDSGLDNSPNSTPLAKVGPGGIEKDTDSLLSPLPYFRLNSSAAYVVTSDTPLSALKYTFEYVGIVDGATNGNIILSNHFFTGASNQMAISLSRTRFYMYRSGASGIYLAWYEVAIPTQFVGRENHYAIVCDFPTYRFFVNGIEIGSSTLDVPASGNKLVLFGDVLSSGTIRNSFTGRLRYSKLHLGIVLPPELFQLPNTVMQRDEALSFLVDKEFSISDMRLKALKSVHAVGQYLIFLFNTWEMLAAFRPEGTEAGIYITRTKLTGNGNLSLVLSNGDEIDMGVIPPIGGSEIEWFTGSGILIEEGGESKYVPLQVGGDITLSESAFSITLSLPESVVSPIDDTKRISIYETFESGNSYRAAQSALVWYEKVFRKATSADGTELEYSENNRVVLPAGKYFVKGFLTTFAGGQTTCRLLNGVTSTELLRSDVSYSSGTLLPGTRNKIMGLITLPSDTELKVETISSESKSAATVPVTAIKGRNTHSELHFYRV